MTKQIAGRWEVGIRLENGSALARASGDETFETREAAEREAARRHAAKPFLDYVVSPAR